MAVRNGTPQSPVDQIPSTQQAESVITVAEPSTSEIDDLDLFPDAQPRYDHPLFEKIFPHLVTWWDSTPPSKTKEEGHLKSAEKTSLESLGAVSSSNLPSHPDVRVKTPPSRSNPSYTEHSTQTTPSLKCGTKCRREEQEEPSSLSGLIVQYVRIKKCRIINQAPK